MRLKYLDTTQENKPACNGKKQALLGFCYCLVAKELHALFSEQDFLYGVFNSAETSAHS
jgi:hypothetical protein